MKSKTTCCLPLTFFSVMTPIFPPWLPNHRRGRVKSNLEQNRGRGTLATNAPVPREESLDRQR